MINLTSKHVVSRKIFMLYVISLFVLWFSVRISNGYITNLSKQIYSYHQIGLVKPCDSLLFSESLGTYLFGIQFLLLIVLILITGQSTSVASKDKSILTETTLITLAALNIAVAILFILALNFIYNPTKAAVVFIFLFIIIVSSFITYNARAKDEEAFSSSKRKFWDMLQNRLKNFSFPHFRVTIILYFVLIFCYGTIVREASTGWLVQSFSKIIFCSIAAICIVYSLLGVVKNINRKDELQRQMFYEQTFLVYVIMIGLLMAYNAFALLFNYTLNERDIMVVLIMALLISGIFVKARYQ